MGVMGLCVLDLQVLGYFVGMLHFYEDEIMAIFLAIRLCFGFLRIN